MRYGYACINLSLGEKIRVNRGMIKRTFLSKGLNYVSELAYQNILDMQKIVEWNVKNDTLAYRMSSDMFPWFTEYEFKQLPNYEKIVNKLSEIGNYSKKNDLRLSFHPGPFNCLASPTESVVEKTISELEKHSEIMDFMNLEKTPNSKINIHVGGAYGDKKKTAKRFCENWDKLSDNLKSRLTVENDDKSSLFTTKDLYDLIYKNIKIPLVFDYLHHRLKNDGDSEEEALKMAVSTWRGYIPCVHFSSSKKIFENKEGTNIKEQAHADYIYEEIKTYGEDLCIILESKAKDLAVIKYKTNKL
jgi:UV DNA damage endonuclease